jgi:hypothetical protein
MSGSVFELDDIVRQSLERSLGPRAVSRHKKAQQSQAFLL